MSLLIAKDWLSVALFSKVCAHADDDNIIPAANAVKANALVADFGRLFEPTIFADDLPCALANSQTAWRVWVDLFQMTR
nr:hypothetical protein [Moraxella lacunata]